MPKFAFGPKPLTSSPHHGQLRPAIGVPRCFAFLLHAPGPALSSQASTDHQDRATTVALVDSRPVVYQDAGIKLASQTKKPGTSAGSFIWSIPSRKLLLKNSLIRAASRKRPDQWLDNFQLRQRVPSSQGLQEHSQRERRSSLLSPGHFPSWRQPLSCPWQRQQTLQERESSFQGCPRWR